MEEVHQRFIDWKKAYDSGGGRSWSYSHGMWFPLGIFKANKNVYLMKAIALRYINLIV
jgi:hypothetical protein